jgi:hypothetical protein
MHNLLGLPITNASWLTLINTDQAAITDVVWLAFVEEYSLHLQTVWAAQKESACHN